VNILALSGYDGCGNAPQVEDFDICWIDCGIPAEAL
jgi:hypothetical protein